MSKCALAWGDSGEEKGEVFTKPYIVEFMLKTSGVYENILLPETRILEPSCGHGEFVLSIAKELCKQASLNGIKNGCNYKHLVTAYDISSKNIANAKSKTFDVLNSNFNPEDSLTLVEHWYRNTDFLIDAD